MDALNFFAIPQMPQAGPAAMPAADRPAQPSEEFAALLTSFYGGGAIGEEPGAALPDSLGSKGDGEDDAPAADSLPAVVAQALFALNMLAVPQEADSIQAPVAGSGVVETAQAPVEAAPEVIFAAGALEMPGVQGGGKEGALPPAAVETPVAPEMADEGVAALEASHTAPSPVPQPEAATVEAGAGKTTVGSHNVPQGAPKEDESATLVAAVTADSAGPIPESPATELQSVASPLPKAQVARPADAAPKAGQLPRGDEETAAPIVEGKDAPAAGEGGAPVKQVEASAGGAGDLRDGGDEGEPSTTQGGERPEAVAPRGLPPEQPAQAREASGTGRPEAAGAERHVGREEILRQVREGLERHAGKRDGEITIRLNPAELGELRVNLRLENQNLKVEMVAASSMVKEILTENLDSLKEALQRQNLNMESFDVTTGREGSPGGSPREGNDAREPRRAAAYGDDRGENGEAAPLEARAHAVRKDALVDVML